MCNIGVVVTNFGRNSILRIFCEGIKRLREETGMEIPVVCAGDKSGEQTLAEYNIQFIEHPNKPLTDKFNRACKELQGKVDYIMVMGSDNLISTETFLRIYAEAEKGIDLIGLSDVYFFGMDDIHAGKLVHFAHTTVLGVGRTVSASVLDKVGWQPWGRPADRGIDVIMLDTVRPYVNTRTLLSNSFVFDLKTSMNLNPIRFWIKKIGAMPDNRLFFDNIGKEEANLVNKFCSLK